MIRSLPLLPCLIIFVSLLFTGLGATFAMYPRQGMPSFESIAEPPSQIIARDIQQVLYPPTANGLAAQRSLLDASPFHPERSAYRREVRARPTPPPVKVYNPVIVGVFGRNQNRRVMIKWETQQEAQTHKMGASTPWGTLTEIGETNLIFDQDGQVRELDLFGR